MKAYFEQAANLAAIFVEREGNHYILGLVTQDGQTVKRNVGLNRERAHLVARHLCLKNPQMGMVTISEGPFIAVDPSHIKDVSSKGENIQFDMHQPDVSFSVTHDDFRMADIYSCLIGNNITLAVYRQHDLPAIPPLTQNEQEMIKSRLADLALS